MGSLCVPSLLGVSKFRRAALTGLAICLVLGVNPAMDLTAIANSEILTEANCPTYDNSEHFGPTRDQADTGLCHSFAVSALFEEALCKQDVRLCGSWVSPLSVAFDYARLASLNPSDQGFDIGDVAYDGLAGFCMDEYEPFNQYLSARNGMRQNCPFNCCPERFSNDVDSQILNLEIHSLMVAHETCHQHKIQLKNTSFHGDLFNQELRSCTSAHALIIEGMQWNKDLKRCQLKLKNSWGKGGDYDGWYDADPFVQNTIKLIYLTPKNGKYPLKYQSPDSYDDHTAYEASKQNLIALENIRGVLVSGKSLAATVCLTGMPSMKKKIANGKKASQSNEQELCAAVTKRFGSVDLNKIYNHTQAQVEVYYPGMTAITKGAVFDVLQCK